jgi:hypothetical protein
MMNDRRSREADNLMRLQRNDRMFTAVEIWCNDDNARQYGAALQHNTVVEDLTFNGCNADDSDLLIQFIETSQSLETFSYCFGCYVHTNARALLAVSKSSSITTLRLNSVIVPPTSEKPSWNN